MLASIRARPGACKSGIWSLAPGASTIACTLEGNYVLSFDRALAAIREAKRLGYGAVTVTSRFRDTSLDEIEPLCRLLTAAGIDGLLLSPGHHYQLVELDIKLAAHGRTESAGLVPVTR